MWDHWGELMSDTGPEPSRPDWDSRHIIAILLGAIESGQTQYRPLAVSISNLTAGYHCQQTASDYSKKESDKISIVWLCTVSLTGSVTTSDLRLSYLMQILTLSASILTFNRNIFTIKVIIYTLYKLTLYTQRWFYLKLFILHTWLKVWGTKCQVMDICSISSLKKSRVQNDIDFSMD